MLSRILPYILFVLAGIAGAETTEVFPGGDLRGALLSLGAGDELIIHDGTYSTQQNGGSYFLEVFWNGTAAQPIVVRAAAGARPIIQGDPSQNVVNVNGSYFTMRGLEIVGGSHGLRLGNVDHAILEDLVIRDIEDVGISCNRPGHACDTLIIRRNEIYNTGQGGGPGEGMYIGCNNAGCVVSNSVITQNYLHDLSGSQADGIEVKTGSYGNTVSDNVIVGANYPGITMYGYADGPGRSRNVVERNFVWDTNDNGIQIVGQVVVRGNIVVASGANGIHSKPSQGFDPHSLDIIHNTIYQAGDACLKTNDWGNGDTSAVVANNALYCSSSNAVRVVGGLGQAVVTGNVGVGGMSGISGGVVLGVSAAADMGNVAGQNFWPTEQSALLGAANALYRSNDFNSAVRTLTDVDAGAYERNADANPGWQLQSGFKALDLLMTDSFGFGGYD